MKSKAVERGLITREQAARLSEREIINLLFMPGFSTAEKITNVSGRGVGMDVVKTNIEKIGGMVDIQNRPDQGTTLKIKIPLTLAIIPALIVTTAGDRYAIPQVSLLELVRLEGKQAQTGIEMIHGAPVYRLRGNLLPLLSLRQELAVDTEEKTSTRSPAMGRGEKPAGPTWTLRAPAASTACGRDVSRTSSTARARCLRPRPSPTPTVPWASGFMAKPSRSSGTFPS